MATGGGTPEIPTCQELRSFIDHMLSAGLSRQTIRERMRSIRAFCNFLERKALVPATSE
jgi:site-specific recombinase XerD